MRRLAPPKHVPSPRIQPRSDGVWWQSSTTCWPALALWFVACYAIKLTHPAQPMAALKPDRFGSYLELLLLWLIPGIYMVISWRRGGHTLGMRAWRLKVLTADGRPAGWKALCIRYVVATVSMLAVGSGFWWALFDRERRCWHDIAAGTQFVRMDRAA